MATSKQRFLLSFGEQETHAFFNVPEQENAFLPIRGHSLFASHINGRLDSIYQK